MKSPSRMQPLQETADVGPGEVVADKEQRTVMLPGHLIRETASENVTGRVDTPSPGFVGRRGHIDNFEAGPVEQQDHLFTDVVPAINKQGFRDRPSRDQQRTSILQRRGTGLICRLPGGRPLVLDSPFESAPRPRRARACSPGRPGDLKYPASDPPG